MQVNEYLNDISSSLPYLLPEAVLSAGILLFFMVQIFAGRAPFLHSALFFVVMIIDVYFLYMQTGMTRQHTFFFQTLEVSATKAWFKLMFPACGLGFVLLRSLSLPTHKHHAELFAIMCLVILGCQLLTITANLLLIFIAIELVSIGSYIVVMLEANKATEAGAKYLLFGLFASALMLYGISIGFGLTGTLQTNDAIFVEQLSKQNILVVSAFIVLFFAGVLFKISAFPFHFWVSDVYETSAPAVAAFLNTCTKIAGFAVLLNTLNWVWKYDFMVYLYEFMPEWPLAACAAVTLLLGNIAALVQTDVKRMLAYSSVAHTGFIFMPLCSHESLAANSVTYYLWALIPATFLVFASVQFFESFTQKLSFEALSGLGKQHIVASVAFTFGLVALTGLPPTAMFWGKFYVFSALWDFYTMEQSKIFLTMIILGALFTVVSLFFYLKAPYFLFFKKPIKAPTDEPIYHNLYKLLLVLTTILVLFIFIYPTVIPVF